ncbi:MAG TPA: HAMP domain-containing sensor histidine kinase [Polyangiaceae bacterium]|nr:HAMP domain-containing sensor histidine kinase [Polyangiaceae bacterium]
MRSRLTPSVSIERRWEQVSASPMRAGLRAGESPQRAHERLEDLYELSKLFVGFESVEHTAFASFRIVGRSVPLRSVILILEGDSRPYTFIWRAEGVRRHALHGVRRRAMGTYAYLVDSAVGRSVLRAVSSRRTKSSRARSSRPPADTGHTQQIILPLVVGRRPIFGAVQFDSTARLDEADLMFANAMVNQLAVALDRHAAIEVAGIATENTRLAAEELARRATIAAENAHLYEVAQSATAVRDELLASVSHDLKTPLSSILMSVEALLADRPQGSLSREQLLHIIKRSGEGMLALIQDLLDTASIEAGGLSVRFVPLKAAVLVGEVLEGFQPIVAKRMLRMQNLLDFVPDVLADPRRIQQVFENLLNNAVKFTPDGGTIGVSAERMGNAVRFAVKDTGVGIPESDVPHLFERFWQASSTAALGSGLGLFIACRIIEAHGGRIWAESVLGAGTSVYFTLPIATLS